MGIVKWLMFIGMVSLGIGSLLATSEPPETLYLDLHVVLNNQSYYETIDVCPDDALTLGWSVSSGEASLSALPSSNVEPLLENKVVSKTGEMAISVKGDTTITLFNKTSSGATGEIKITITTLFEDVCEVLSLLPSHYEGVLNQTVPEVVMLERSLDLSVIDRRIEALLSHAGNGFYMQCKVSSAQTLSCRESDKPDSFRLEGQITATGFTGTYEGIQKGSSFETAVKGTFSFVKEELP